MVSTGHVYTVLLGAGRRSGGSFTVEHTAPGGYSTVVRDIVISNLDTQTATVVVDWAYQGLEIDLLRMGLTANATFHLDLRQQLVVGAQLRSYSSGSLYTVSITGYRFGTAAPGVGLLPTQPWLWGDSPQDRGGSPDIHEVRVPVA